MNEVKLEWESTFKADPNDTLSVSAVYMGIDFHVELQDDGRFLPLIMTHGALYELPTMSIRQRAIDRVEKIFREMLADPSNTMRIAENYTND
jgi:hypothetical protein